MSKLIHRAEFVNSNGGVSALCFDKPRSIDLGKATWTNRPEAVTCKKCRERQVFSFDKTGNSKLQQPKGSDNDSV